jgi:hypothetical protein
MVPPGREERRGVRWEDGYVGVSAQMVCGCYCLGVNGLEWSRVDWIWYALYGIYGMLKGMICCGVIWHMVYGIYGIWYDVI